VLVNSRREFEIAFVGLKPGIHEFDYHITDKFFDAYRQQDFDSCEATVKLSLDKQNGFMMLKFEISGQVDVTCDRCGNRLPLDLWDEFGVVVKLVEDPKLMNEEEEDPDVYYISRGESHLHLADWIYEFINLSIPFQRACKDEELGGPHCNKEVLAVLKKMDKEKSNPENSLWKGLDKFKDLE